MYNSGSVFLGYDNEIKDIAVRSTFMFDYDILFQKIVNYVKNAINNNYYYLDKNPLLCSKCTINKIKYLNSI